MSRHDLTFNGGMQISTAQKKFGNSSWLFDGSNDYVSANNPGTDFAFGTGDFSVEFQANWVAVDGSQRVFVNQYAGGNYSFLFDYVSGQLRLYAVSGTLNVTANFTPTAGTWYHIALARSSGVVSIYVNGTSLTLAANTNPGTDIPQRSEVVTFGGVNGGYFFSGYIDEIRISKGIARWTANFTPPDQPYVADQYTVLLCHCEADMLGTGAHSMTTVGAPVMVVAAPTANYGGSLEVNGSNYVSLAASSDFDFDADFTVDFHLRSTDANSDVWILGNVYSAGWLVHRQGASMFFWVNGSNLTFPVNVVQNAWTHLAFVRKGATITLYQDGVSTGTVTSSASIVSASTLKIGNPTQSFTGNIAGLRISKGLARWTANFTPPNAPYSKPIGGVDGYTKLMLHFDKGNNSAIFEDSSLTPKNITVTGAGSPVQKSDQMMFGRSCGYFNGSSYLTIPRVTDIDPGSGDFTFDFWIYMTNISLTNSVFGSTVHDNGWNGFRWDGAQQSWRFMRYGGADVVNAADSISANTWYHISVCRSGSTVRLFRDGVQKGSGTSSTDFNFIDAMCLGSSGYISGAYLTGYLDEFRISKNIARHTTNFTPPTKPYDAPAVDGYTKLLLPMNGTNGSTLFPDKGVTGHTVTANGGAAISTTAYKFNGSSGYFDGAANYLTVPDNADFGMTGDLTVEGWINFAAIKTGSNRIMQMGNFQFEYNTSVGLDAYWGAVDFYRAWTPVTGRWYHVAFVRSGSSLMLFADGQQLGSTGSGAQAITSGITYFGRFASGSIYDANCYLQDIRISKGIARWTANFTPPVRPYGS